MALASIKLFAGSPLVAVLVVTGVGGGIIATCWRVGIPMILRTEIYAPPVSSAVLSATAHHSIPWRNFGCDETAVVTW